MAHDTLEGRGTGQPGAAKTADYILDFYQSPGFLAMEDFEVKEQVFELEGYFWTQVTYTLSRLNSEDNREDSSYVLEKGGTTAFYPVMNGTDRIEAPVIFTGHGPVSRPDHTVSEDYHTLEDAWVLMFENTDASGSGDEEWSRTEQIQRISGYYGAAGVIYISDLSAEEWEQKAGYMSRQLDRPLAVRKSGGFRSLTHGSATALSVHPDMALKLLGLTRHDQLDSLKYRWKSDDKREMWQHTGFELINNPEFENRTFEERNIVAVFEGSHESRDQEVIVMSAHYDHMGLGEPDDNNDIVYNGADDNGSGTAALMQVAEAFRKVAETGYRPSRTLVFLHAAAEEWGLFGARHFVENSPVPLENIIANVNVDMVGWVDERYSDQPSRDYMYVIGAGLVSSDLENLLSETSRARPDLHLDMKYNSIHHPSGLYRRSDQWAFGEKGVPFVFFFSGLHDYYHTPSDTADRIAWKQLTARTEFIVEYVWRLAEYTSRPEFDRNPWNRQGVISR
ncbi:M28 family peptidase [Balneolales bacterium ANBcel1]|nr:M28 family peptidase [Balneolales bacterium ANBcel1]